MSSPVITPRFRPARWAAVSLAAALALSACSGTTSSPTADTTKTGATASAPAPATPALILATTTSTQDSGLLDELVPAFEKATGYQVKTVAVGTGQALKMGEQGNADVLLVHAPAKEKTFVQAGYGVDRRLVGHNYFLVVGPSADPAGIGTAKNATEAFKKIAAAKATFVSRADGSGTETKELAIWKKANVTPKGQTWYLESGQGMGATLQIASQKQGYTLSDDATFMANTSKLKLTSLVKGDPFLLNIYHVISVNPAKSPKVNHVGAKAFAGFVTSSAGQELIAGFGKAKYGQPLFVADAGKDEADVK
jgi:tungstate transport system substrate-binding protein